MDIVFQRNRLNRAYVRACAAGLAGIMPEHDLRNWGLGFGIGTPAALQGASLEKHRGADTRPVL